MPAQPPTFVPVLMYHAFADRATDGFRRYTVPPALFAEHLDALAGAGWRVVPFGAAVDALTGGAAAGGDGAGPGRAAAAGGARPRLVGLTVDDGFADFAEHALPALAARGMGASLFVPTAFVGRTSGWLPGEDARRPMLGWDDLAAVARAGIEIGAHGHRHVGLDVQRPDVLVTEVRRPRDELSQRLGVPVTALAYPYGHAGRAARREATRAGYRAACVVTDLAASRHEPLTAVTRLTVTPDLDAAGLLALLQRRSSPLARAEARSRQVAWRAWRRLGPPRVRPDRLRPLAPGRQP